MYLFMSFFFFFFFKQKTAYEMRISDWSSDVCSSDLFGWGGIGNPFIITQLVGFLVFLTATQAELAQPLFDMTVAESEIVTGYMTEYSGIRFLLLIIGEFATAGDFAAIAATMFLGGWAVPFVDTDDNIMTIVRPLVLFAKLMLVGLLI